MHEIFVLQETEKMCQNLKAYPTARNTCLVGREIRMVEMTAGRPGGKKPLEGFTSRWECNIKIDLREINLGGGGL
jgi:hypothetical protein